MSASDLFGQLRPILDQFYIGVLVVDHQGLIIYYNQRLAEIDELSQEEVLGYRIPEVYSVRPQESPSMIALATRQPVRGSLMHYKTARGRQVSSFNHAFPIFDHDQLRGAICFVTDISSLTSQLMDDGGKKTKAPRATPTPEAKVRFEDIIGNNPVFREAIDVAKVAAMGPSPVMLVGETGTGKDLIAKAIHDYGARADKAFMAINCSAIPEALLEGILFGTTRGAFTGAVEKEGLFEHASGGTLFLDEINSMPLALQAKLLRVMQDHKVRRVGGLTEKTVDLRIISASNTPPLKAVEERHLRSDLYYRLAVVQVTIPPLRERPEDIPRLTHHFINKVCARLGKYISGVSREVLNSLMHRPWPGNVRELEHAIESALNFATDGEQLTLRHLKRSGRHAGLMSRKEPAEAAPRAQPPAAPGADYKIDPKVPLRQTLEEVERRCILEALRGCGGQINKAAAELGLSPQLLGYKIKKYDLRTNPFKENF